MPTELTKLIEGPAKVVCMCVTVFVHVCGAMCTYVCMCVYLCVCVCVWRMRVFRRYGEGGGGRQRIRSEVTSNIATPMSVPLSPPPPSLHVI